MELALSYPFASRIDPGWGLRLASAGIEPEPSLYFEGPLEAPRETANVLLVLARIAHSRFFLPSAARDLDPIVTAAPDMLRFEAFSSDNGVYARVDLPGVTIARHGTTHVDFNDAFRKGLATLAPADDVRLHVGSDGLTLVTATERLHERRVHLSKRWLRGLCEVQSHQRSLEPAFDVPAAEVLQLVRGLAAKQPHRPGSLVRSPRLRLVFPAREDAVTLAGAERLRLLEPALLPGRRVTIYRGADGVSAFEVVGRATHLWLVLSADTREGFSGDGQLLDALARPGWLPALPALRASLAWQARLDASQLASTTGCSRDIAEAALAGLATQGAVGFDARARAYFHRELPFDLSAIDVLQPRLRAARRLVDRVELGDDGEVRVPGTGVHHIVKLDGDDGRCSCHWHARHQGRRGPCKHILAARLAAEKASRQPR